MTEDKMTIDEAIKTLENERKDHHSFSTDITGKALGLGIEALKFVKALGLGIEALKFVEADRVKYPYVKVPLLPGETEET